MKILIGVVVVTCLLLFLFREQWLMAIGNFLIIKDTLHPADVIHVIAGDNNYRLDYAIELYRHGYGKKIFLTGGGWCHQHLVNYGMEWKGRALAQGVLEEDIVIDDGKIISTHDEVEWLKIWIEKSHVPIRSVIVVSDAFHMRRSRWTYKKVLGDGVEVEMAPVPFEMTPYRQVWWKDNASRKFVSDEYLKYLYYIARYQLSSGRFQKWLISLDTK